MPKRESNANKPQRAGDENERIVKALLAGLSPEVHATTLALRAVIRRTAPDTAETVVWGGLSYHRPQVGGRVKGAVCQIGVKGDHVRLDFIHGIRLADPAGLLQGDQLSKRFIPIDSVEAAQRPEIAQLIRQAAALEWTGAGAAQPSRKQTPKPRTRNPSRGVL